MGKKKIIIALTILFSLFLIWYLLIKKDDYTITFKVKSSTGTVFQGINDWANTRQKSENEKFTIVKKNNFESLVQLMTKEDVSVIYNWELKSINDSTTAVSVGINDNDHKIWNRISAPFGSKFIKNEIEKIKAFKTGIEEHIGNFKIGKVEKGSSPEVFVAYITLNSVLAEKAQTMIGNDAVITGYLHNNNIKIVGKPYLEVVNLDLENEKLTYNYCFPIDKNTQYSIDNNVKIKTISAKKGLKISYFGNYRTSDRAWFKIMDYAKSNNIDLELLPLEHFLNNPFNGGTELEWETQIIIPTK
jgi:effector-binding domain-containing protein